MAAHEHLHTHTRALKHSLRQTQTHTRQFGCAVECIGEGVTASSTELEWQQVIERSTRQPFLKKLPETNNNL